MKRFLKSFRYGERGFTLIELLVVIAILGILAAIVVPNFLNLIGSGHNEAACIEEKMVQTGAVAFAAEHNGTFPAADGFPVSAEMDAYFIGGVANLLGEYTIAGGVVTQTGYADGTPCPPPA